MLYSTNNAPAICLSISSDLLRLIDYIFNMLCTGTKAGGNCGACGSMSHLQAESGAAS
jgi:hypothetical protein